MPPSCATLVEITAALAADLSTPTEALDDAGVDAGRHAAGG